MAAPHLESKLSVGGGRSGECSLWSHRWPPPPKYATKSHGIPQWLLASQCGTQNLMETGKSGNLTMHEINSECWEMPSSPVCSGTRQSSQLFHPNRGAKQKEPVCQWIERTATALSSGGSTITTQHPSSASEVSGAGG